MHNTRTDLIKPTMMNAKRIKQLKIALAVVFAVWLIQPALACRKYDAQHEGVRALKETATSRNNSSHYQVPDYYQSLPSSLTVDLEKARVRKAAMQGAAGVDMGRNVLQAECPKAMLRAIRMVVHENAKPEEAFKAYELWKKDVK